MIKTKLSNYQSTNPALQKVLGKLQPKEFNNQNSPEKPRKKNNPIPASQRGNIYTHTTKTTATKIT